MSNDPIYDGNGNVSEYLMATGAVATHFEYDPFGNIVKESYASGFDASSFSYKFSTKPLDLTTGLYFYLYRYYDPLTGRWPSRDLIEESGGVNLYGFVGNDGVGKWDYLGLSEHKTKKIVLIAGPDYATPNGTARGDLAKTFGVADGTSLYNGKHPLGITKEHMDELIQTTLANWGESANQKCCYDFQTAKFESSSASPMTIDRAKSLVSKYSNEALTIVTAHGVRDALPNNETGLVFYKGIDKSNGFNWGLTYPVSALTTNELNELPILACNDAGLPSTVGKTKVIKVGGNQFGSNFGAELTGFISNYVKKQCDACK